MTENAKEKWGGIRYGKEKKKKNTLPEHENSEHERPSLFSFILLFLLILRCILFAKH